MVAEDLLIHHLRLDVMQIITVAPLVAVPVHKVFAHRFLPVRHEGLFCLLLRGLWLRIQAMQSFAQVALLALVLQEMGTELLAWEGCRVVGILLVQTVERQGVGRGAVDVLALERVLA